MIIQQPIGTLSEEIYAGYTVDYLPIEWYHAHKKIDRLHTVSGVEVGIRLDDATALRGLQPEDVLWAEEGKCIAIQILPCECLVMEITDHHQIPKLCYEIGNRHAPFFYGQTHHQFITPYDAPMQKMVEKLGVSVSVQTLSLDLRHSISSNTGHGHSHSH